MEKRKKLEELLKEENSYAYKSPEARPFNTPDMIEPVIPGMGKDAIGTNESPKAPKFEKLKKLFS